VPQHHELPVKGQGPRWAPTCNDQHNRRSNHRRSPGSKILSEYVYRCRHRQLENNSLLWNYIGLKSTRRRTPVFRRAKSQTSSPPRREDSDSLESTITQACCENDTVMEVQSMKSPGQKHEWSVKLRTSPSMKTRAHLESTQ
jgi:hypothetical protein